MLTTRFTELVGCRIPLQQAPIGNCAIPRLAAAVANAGGMGMVTVTGDTPDEVASTLDAARRFTAGPFGANFFLLMADRGLVRECVAAAAERARVVDFFYADPDPDLVAVVHATGALASWQVGSAEEARAAVAAGCDLIVVQGHEAGGHVRGTLGLLPLLDAVLPETPVPTLAAGGIASGRAMAAALAAGADGVRVGTRFVAAVEAEAHPEYVAAIIAATPQDTVVSDTFSHDYPGAPHRALRASIAAAVAWPGDVVGVQRSDESGVIKDLPIHRFQKLTVTRHVSGEIAAMPHWAGESVRGVHRLEPAAAIVAELAGEAESLLRRWNHLADDRHGE